ncbi:hypothetical protein FA09DRAFT_331659 [Tilletiopsis washingtonensis]|uniref:Uncharacterized protein n=1 Tax=Tilletiopsis washingtonensis TaxID=58919 RepID=A0A316Z3A7_9BASI|nr:hypothetical protein FA09DRAFT_331659 [Tilletiopsis washingtonensis]PWN96069.1 hypothetical protein FA09DRAFT_331659 [Tilletiopsis washingtonensis]
MEARRLLGRLLTPWAAWAATSFALSCRRPARSGLDAALPALPRRGCQHPSFARARQHAQAQGARGSECEARRGARLYPHPLPALEPDTTLPSLQQRAGARRWSKRARRWREQRGARSKRYRRVQGHDSKPSIAEPRPASRELPRLKSSASSKVEKSRTIRPGCSAWPRAMPELEAVSGCGARCCRSGTACTALSGLTRQGIP